MTHKSLIQRVAEKGFETIAKSLMKHPSKEFKHRFHQAIEQQKIAYEITPPGYSRDIILGTYKLLVDKYEHTFGEKFDNTFHARIRRDIADIKEVTRWNKRRIYGEEGKK